MTTAAILLAAGRSSRMGRGKPLLPWLRSQPLVACQAQALHVAGYRPIIVVLGHEADLVRPAVPALEGLTIVEHPGYDQGRSSSVVRGLQALPDDADGVLVLSVDAPRPAAMLRALREAFEASHPALAVLAHQGKAGHPWLFSASLKQELEAIGEENEGLREVEKRHQGEELLVEAGSDVALLAFNTPDEYEAALAQEKAAEAS